MRPDRGIAQLASCRTCRGKQTYPTRAQARKGARRFHAGERLNAYECPSGIGWHIGHLPTAVRAGRAARSDIYTQA